MLDMLWNIPNQSALYLVSLMILLAMTAESASRLRELRWGLAGIVYLTIGLWYFVDPIYRPESYAEYQGDELAMVYMQVLIFLFVFRAGIEVAVPRTPSRILRAFDPRQLDRGPFVKTLLTIWFLLFVIGSYRADFRVIDALFPLGGRWEGAQMWNRERLGGVVDFFVSVGFYSYLMSCAVFGLIAVGTRRAKLRAGMIVMMCLTWPMFALSGSRSMFMAVAIPRVLAILILKRWTRIQQVLFLVACFSTINVLMLISITYRNTGISQFFSEDSYTAALADAQHAGLNMPEELVYINRYQQQGLLELEWGYEYFAQLVNFVPRFIWPGKPFPGEQFAALRVGYFQGAVAATISNGVVGQGVQNFGRWLGPAAPALLLTLLISWMCRLPERGIPFMRSCLVIFLMALIPNLGRDLTLMTLWPALFAAAGVFVYEGGGRRRAARTSQRRSVKSAKVVSPTIRRNW